MTERDDCIYIAPQDARHWWASPAMHLPLKACSADAITDHQRCSLDAVQYDHSMGNVQDLTGEAIYSAQSVAV